MSRTARRLFWLLPLLGAACTGLHLENGNSYPCDFSEAPGVRDEVCQPGDICGTDDVCKPFIYEGPRFEGKATLPEFGPDSSEGALLHPLVLNSPVREVVADLPLSLTPSAFARLEAGAFELSGGKIYTKAIPDMVPGLGAVSGIQTFSSTERLTSRVERKLLARNTAGLLVIQEPGLGLPKLVSLDGGPFTSAGVRVVSVPSAPSSDTGFRPEAAPVAWNSTVLGEIEQVAGGWALSPWITDPGRVLDVAALVLPRRHFTFVLQVDGISVIDRSDRLDGGVSDGGVSDGGVNDGGVNEAGMEVLATFDTLMVDKGWLKSDVGNRVITAVRTGPLLPNMTFKVDVLSTFQVNVTADGATLTSPWPDCTPCRNGERLELVAPSVRSGAATVDVLCRTLTNGFRPVRVVGSVALTQLDVCITEEVTPSIELSRIAGPPGPVVQWNSQAGLLLGGENGELWSGETLTTLEPAYLDRVPLDVAPANAGGAQSLAVIADDYLAIQQLPTIDPLDQRNGFRRISPRELGVEDDLRLLAFVHGVEGWGVADDGTVVQARFGPTVELRRGPQLVTASGDPIRSSIGGEAFVPNDGGPATFFVAADDSLYFVEDPEGAVELVRDQDVQLLPDLTPEPSVPIRSLALERTPLGTDPLGTTGVTRARGYLVTSRNVYSWELSGTPSRWSVTPRVLTAGEPVEVWFDAPRSALGRVGYRDGQIFSLPGGYQLAEALPPGSDGEPSLVLDFENLGGWPVAYTSTGLFIAGWAQVDGQLQNRFDGGVNRPMEWTEVKLAGSEATPWLVLDGPVRLRGAKPGKLFVASDPPISQAAGVPDAGTQLHRLLIFTDDEVRQVARHLRKLSDLR